MDAIGIILGLVLLIFGIVIVIVGVADVLSKKSAQTKQENTTRVLPPEAPAAQNKKSAFNKRFWIAFIILTVAVGALNGILKSQGYTLSGLGTFFMHLCAFLLAYIIGGKQK